MLRDAFKFWLGCIRDRTSALSAAAHREGCNKLPPPLGGITSTVGHLLSLGDAAILFPDGLYRRRYQPGVKSSGIADIILLNREVVV